jgi:hypothetical protein
MTRRRLPALGALAIAAALGLSACASTLRDAATVRFGGPFPSQHVDRAEFERELRALAESAPFAQLLADIEGYRAAASPGETVGSDLTAVYLRQAINQAPVDALFELLGLTVTDAHRLQAESATRADLGLRAEFDEQGRFTGPGAVFDSLPEWMRDRLVERKAREVAIAEYYGVPTPEKLRRFFDDFREEICPSRRIVSHVLVRTAADAREALAALHRGEPFPTVAQRSIDEQTKERGGRLGCLAPGVFVEEFERAAQAAPYGEPVGPVRTQFGYHILLVDEVTFEAVRDQLAQPLQQGAARQLLARRMDVWVNPRFGRAQTTPSEQGPPRVDIVPPSAPAPREQRERDDPATTTSPFPSGR